MTQWGKISAVVSGTLFSIGLWVVRTYILLSSSHSLLSIAISLFYVCYLFTVQFIAGSGKISSPSGDDVPFEFVDCLPFIGGFIAFFLFLIFDWDRVDAEDYEYTNKNVAAIAKFGLFFTIMISTASFIGAALVLQKWTEMSESTNKPIAYAVGQLIGSLLVMIRYFVAVFVFSFIARND